MSVDKYPESGPNLFKRTPGQHCSGLMQPKELTSCSSQQIFPGLSLPFCWKPGGEGSSGQGWIKRSGKEEPLSLSLLPSLGLVESGTEIKGISLTLGPVIRKLFTDLEDRDSVSREGVMAEGPGECQASQGSPITPPQSACLLAAGTSGLSPMSPCCSLRDRTMPSPSPHSTPLSQAVLGCSFFTAPSICFPLLSYSLYQSTHCLVFLLP